jgi:carbamate kinase
VTKAQFDIFRSHGESAMSEIRVVKAPAMKPIMDIPYVSWIFVVATIASGGGRLPAVAKQHHHSGASLSSWA